MLAPVWIKGKLSLFIQVLGVVSKTVRLEKLIWEGEDVRFDAAARGRLNRELHVRFEVRAESRGCYQAALETICNMDWLERAGVKHHGSVLLCPSKEQLHADTMWLGENWQRGEKKRDVKHSYILVLLSAFFSIRFLSARFPPEWKTVCMRTLLSVVLASIALSIF